MRSVGQVKSRVERIVNGVYFLAGKVSWKFCFCYVAAYFFWVLIVWGLPICGIGNIRFSYCFAIYF